MAADYNFFIRFQGELKMVDILESCRICAGVEFESVMSLGHQLMTGTFPKSKNQKCRIK